MLCPGFCLQQVRSLITNLYIRHNWIYSQTQAAMDIYQTIWCRHKPLWIYARPFGADTSRYGYMPDRLVQTQAAMDICQTIWCRHRPLWIYARPFGADTGLYGYIPDHLIQTQASMDIYQTIWCRHRPLWIYTRPFGALGMGYDNYKRIVTGLSIFEYSNALRFTCK